MDGRAAMVYQNPGGQTQQQQQQQQQGQHPRQQQNMYFNPQMTQGGMHPGAPGGVMPPPGMHGAPPFSTQYYPTALPAQPAAQTQMVPERMQALRDFWKQQTQEMDQADDFKNHTLPLARIKKIMKSDEDVRMIASEAPALFSKACELFILELTWRAWNNAEDNKRRTLQKDDVSAAINSVEVFDFLVDVVPQPETKPKPGDARPSVPVPGMMPTMPQYYQPQMMQPGQMPQMPMQMDPSHMQHQGPGQPNVANPQAHAPSQQ